MSECPALDLQDLLPDFVVGRLDPEATDSVVTHLAYCAACRGDVAVLRQIHAFGVEAPVIDTTRVAAAVMAQLAAPPVASQAATRPALHVVDGTATPTRSTPIPARRSVWRRVGPWQVAAALTIVVSGILATTMARRGVPEMATIPGDSVPAQVAAATMGSVAVSYGDLSEYSEGELETMLATLDEWDGTARAEPVSFDPVVVPVGGNR